MHLLHPSAGNSECQLIRILKLQRKKLKDDYSQTRALETTAFDLTYHGN